MNTVEWVKQICKDRKIPLSKVEKDLGFANGYISRLKKGTFPADRLEKIADYLDVPLQELMNPPKTVMEVTSAMLRHGEPPQTVNFADLIFGKGSLGVTRRIPVLGRVAAGLPTIAEEEIIGYEEVTGRMAIDGDYFALQIKGDSMEPKFSNGDIVIVRQQEYADDGDIVIALVNGNDAVCKRLKKYQDGIALVSTNPAYDPMYFSGNEIDETPVRIIGKVKELRAKF